MGRPSQSVAGPQGRAGQFVVECGFSHALPDDPIVHPGEPGASHLHVFFGSAVADSDVSLSEMLGGTTTCDSEGDTASYWAPALLDDGTLIEPDKSVAYYRAGVGVDPEDVVPFPPGLRMIAGDASAVEPQPVTVAAWSCGVGADRSSRPPQCPSGRGLRMDVVFPDCWDGQNLDLPGHRRHMRYSDDGACPASHPVHVPQLIFTVAYPVTGDVSHLRLASGDPITIHADFINAWNQESLTREVALCLNRDAVCGVTSGRISG